MAQKKNTKTKKTTAKTVKPEVKAENTETPAPTSRSTMISNW